MRETTEHSVEVSIVHPTGEEVHRPDGAGVSESAPPSEKKAAPGAARAATMEHLLYAVILAAAVLLRLIGLGREPLSPQESAAAWSAWLAANQQFVVGAPAPESALLYGLQSLLFWLIGDGDALARAIPALFGVATVLLPWFWRPWIGRTAALVVAALFAIDPWLMAFSRRSDAAALTIFLGLLTLTALWRRSHALDARQALRWERTAAVAAALFLTSGPLMWGLLPVLAFFILIYGVDRSGAGEETPSGWLFHRSTWLWFGVPLALAATGLTLRFEALSALSASLTAWIVAIAGLERTNPLAWPFARLLLDQPLLVVFGVLGLASIWAQPVLDALRREQRSDPEQQRELQGASWLLRGADERLRLPIFLSVWVAWGLLLWLLPGRPPETLPIVGIPLAIAAALLIGRALPRPWGDLTGLELFALLVIQIVLLVAGSIWLAASVNDLIFNEQIWLRSGVLVGLMAAVWLTFGFWAGWRSTGRVALVFYAVVLAALTVRSGWQLNHTSELMQPDGFWPVHTHAEMRLLVQDVERLSSIRRGDPHEIEVQLIYNLRPNPALGWSLRHMRNLHHVRTLDATVFDIVASAQRMPLVIAPTSRNDSLPLPDPYIGSRYDVEYTWRLSMLPASQQGVITDASAEWRQVQRPRLRWLLYRKVDQPPPTETVTLWAPR